MSPYFNVQNWVLRLAAKLYAGPETQRQELAASFSALLRRFAVSQSGGLSKEKKAEKDRLTTAAFTDFIRDPPKKPVDGITRDELAPSFSAMVDFFGWLASPEAPMDGLGPEAKPAPQATGSTGPHQAELPVPAPKAEPPVGDRPIAAQHNCVFTPEMIAAIAALASYTPQAGKVPPTGDAETKTPQTPAAQPNLAGERKKEGPASAVAPIPDLFAETRPTVKIGAAKTEEGNAQGVPTKKYSLKSKLAPKGQEKITMSFPIEAKKKLMNVAKSRGTTATKLLIGFIESL